MSFLASVCCQFVLGQIDTSIHFPLATGNYWEYNSKSPSYDQSNYVTVIGDATMDNGKTYRQLKEVYRYQNTFSTSYTYLRIVDNYFVFKYINDTSCAEKELLLFNLAAPVKTFWDLCGRMGHFSGDKRCYGLYSINNDYSLNGCLYERKYFTTVILRNTDGFHDTLWSPIQGTLIEYFFVTGIGITLETTGSMYPDLVLTGAIINGKKYGTITGVYERKANNLVNSRIEIGANPNPFNGQTNIKISNNIFQQVELSIYDILGRKITSLYKGNLGKGTYNFQFNSSGLSSGAYLVCLRTPFLLKTQKIINLK
jgi:hypothetical protein